MNRIEYTILGSQEKEWEQLKKIFNKLWINYVSGEFINYFLPDIEYKIKIVEFDNELTLFINNDNVCSIKGNIEKKYIRPEYEGWMRSSINDLNNSMNAKGETPEKYFGKNGLKDKND